MKLSDTGTDILNTFSPRMVRTSGSEWAWIVFLLAVMAVGGYALYLQIAEGHGVTGMRDHVVWGIFIANFIFLIGLSYAGAIFAGLLQLSGVAWGKSIIRMAKLMTIVSVIVGPIFILLCVGRFDRLHYLILYPRLQSPLTWDVLAVVTFLVGSILFLYVGLISDFAAYRDSNLPFARWKQKLFRWLSLGYAGVESQRRRLAVSQNLLAIILIPLSIIVASILSWIFGMTLRPGWHSTIFGPYFVLGAIYSGSGVLIILMWYYRNAYQLHRYITDTHFKYLAYIMLVLAAGYGYFTFSEYFTSWYASEKWDSELIHKLFSPSEYGWMTLFTNVGGVVLPILFAAIPALRKPGYLALVSFVMVIAMWVKRYLIVVPTLETPLLPMQDIRPEYIKYSITWVEWAMTLGGIALFLLLFTLAAKMMTILPVTTTASHEITSEKEIVLA